MYFLDTTRTNIQRSYTIHVQVDALFNTGSLPRLCHNYMCIVILTKGLLSCTADVNVAQIESLRPLPHDIIYTYFPLMKAM